MSNSVTICSKFVDIFSWGVNLIHIITWFIINQSQPLIQQYSIHILQSRLEFLLLQCIQECIFNVGMNIFFLLAELINYFGSHIMNHWQCGHNLYVKFANKIPRRSWHLISKYMANIICLSVLKCFIQRFAPEENNLWQPQGPTIPFVTSIGLTDDFHSCL